MNEKLLNDLRKNERSIGFGYGVLVAIATCLVMITCLLLLLSCHTEPIEADCGCIKTEYQFIVIGEYAQLEPYEVDCQDEITLANNVKSLPEGADAWAIECDLKQL